jgi:hypothetical protein
MAITIHNNRSLGINVRSTSTKKRSAHAPRAERFLTSVSKARAPAGRPKETKAFPTKGFGFYATFCFLEAR